MRHLSDLATPNGRVGGTAREAAPEVVAAAHDAVKTLAAQSSANVSATTIRLTPGEEGTETRPSRPAVARIGLTVDGRPLQVEAAAPTPGEAVGLAIGRLRDLMNALGAHDGHRAKRVSGPGPGQRRLDRLGPRPAGRETIHREWCPLAVQTPDEAADALEAGDEPFHLFIDAESGSDSVIYQGAPNGYLLAQVTPGLPVRGPSRIALTVNAIPAPRMTLPQAGKELAALESPFLFFTDEATGRGNLLYRHRDGGYRLVLPAV